MYIYIYIHIRIYIYIYIERERERERGSSTRRTTASCPSRPRVGLNSEVGKRGWINGVPAKCP